MKQSAELLNNTQYNNTQLYDENTNCYTTGIFIKTIIFFK